VADELTDRQNAFIREYLKDFNATQAAIRAGYSPTSAAESGCENLIKSNIRSEIDRIIAQRAARVGISVERVLQEYARIAFFNPTTVVSVTEKGTVLITPTDELDEDDSACIAEVSSKETLFGADVKIKFHDKLRALDTLAKHLRIVNDPSVGEVVESFAEVMTAAKERARRAE